MLSTQVKSELLVKLGLEIKIKKYIIIDKNNNVKYI